MPDKSPVGEWARKDIVHVTRHLCTRVRMDAIKVMPRGISGGKQVIKLDDDAGRF